MADANFEKRLSFAFLDDIKRRFLSAYGDRGMTAIAYGMNEQFARTLETQMVHFTFIYIM